MALTDKLGLGSLKSAYNAITNCLDSFNASNLDYLTENSVYCKSRRKFLKLAGLTALVGATEGLSGVSEVFAASNRRNDKIHVKITEISPGIEEVVVPYEDGRRGSYIVDYANASTFRDVPDIVIPRKGYAYADFIEPNATLVEEFMDRVRAKYAGFDEQSNIAKVATVVSELKNQGFKYDWDNKRADAGDFDYQHELQTVNTTIALKAGRCVNLSSTLVSLLGNAGVDSKIAVGCGHNWIVFDVGIEVKERYLFGGPGLKNEPYMLDRKYLESEGNLRNFMHFDLSEYLDKDDLRIALLEPIFKKGLGVDYVD